MEIVTDPDLRSPQEAYDYLQTLKLTLQYLDVSDCDMEKGSLRCDANISIREKGQTTLGTKAELKNMNSFRAVKIALEFEVNRHQQMYAAGECIIQETRLWNEEKGITIPMRSKEEAPDYRYFPEPDLVPFTINQTTIDTVKKTLPELPAEKLKRLMEQYELSEYDAQIIIQDRELANYFEECVLCMQSTKYLQANKKISNWIIGPLQQELNSRRVSIKTLGLTPKNFTDLIRKVEDGVISNLVGKDVLIMMIDQGKAADTIIAAQGLAQISDDATLEKAVDEIIAANQTIVDQIKQGKENAMGFLIGQTMKKTQGKANPKKVGDIIKRRLLNA